MKNININGFNLNGGEKINDVKMTGAKMRGAKMDRRQAMNQSDYTDSNCAQYSAFRMDTNRRRWG